MFNHTDPTVGSDIHDLFDVADDLLACDDEFPTLEGVVAPKDSLVNKHGQEAVDDSRLLLHRLGYLESAKK